MHPLNKRNPFYFAPRLMAVTVFAGLIASIPLRQPMSASLWVVLVAVEGLAVGLVIRELLVLGTKYDATGVHSPLIGLLPWKKLKETANDGHTYIFRFNLDQRTYEHRVVMTQFANVQGAKQQVQLWISTTSDVATESEET